MPSKPQYIQNLITSVEVLKDQAQNLRKDNENLKKADESLRQSQSDLRLELLKELTARDEKLKDADAELRRENALTNHKVEALTKRLEEWERRWWALIFLLMGAVLTLASGLIVTLVRR